MRSYQYLIAYLRIREKHAPWSNSHMIAEHDVSPRRPKQDVPLTMHVSPVLNPWMPNREDQHIPESV